jgi:hypothetical protein
VILSFTETAVSFTPRDLSKPILGAFAFTSVFVCKADGEARLERFRLPATTPDACSGLSAGKPGFSLVLSATLRGIGQPKMENLSGMTYHEFVLCGKFCSEPIPNAVGCIMDSTKVCGYQVIPCCAFAIFLKCDALSADMHDEASTC